MDSKTALVISDNTQIDAVCGDVLAPRGWAIHNAIDNSVALRLVERKQFDLILTCDNILDQEDVELLCAIRRVHPHTRAIILTDKSTPPSTVSAIREHAFSCFFTPFSVARLTPIVERALDEPCWDDGIECVSVTTEGISMHVRCDRNTSGRLIHFLHEVLDLPTAEKRDVSVALRELLLNAIEFCGKPDAVRYVEVSYLRTGSAVTCKIRDTGGRWSPANMNQALMQPPDDRLRHLAHYDGDNLHSGGFGVLTITNSVDEFFYNEQGNEVVLIKYLDCGHRVFTAESEASHYWG